MTPPPPDQPTGRQDPGPAPTGPLPPDAEEEAADAAARAGAGSKRLWWWVGGLAVAAMTAVAVWFGLSATSGRVHWVYTGHEIVSPTQVDVRFDLRRDPSREVTCRLEAQDGGHTVVGRTQVDVAPSATSPSRHVAAVQTATEAVTGYVDVCWYSDEAPPGGR